VDALEVFIYDVNFLLVFTAQILGLKLFSFWVIVPSVSVRLLLRLGLPLVVENPLFFRYNLLCFKLVLIFLDNVLVSLAGFARI